MTDLCELLQETRDEIRNRGVGWNESLMSRIDAALAQHQESAELGTPEWTRRQIESQRNQQLAGRALTPEPVAWVHGFENRLTPENSGLKARVSFVHQDHWTDEHWKPLYTNPPSAAALIAEQAAEIERLKKSMADGWDTADEVRNAFLETISEAVRLMNHESHMQAFAILRDALSDRIPTAWSCNLEATDGRKCDKWCGDEEKCIAAFTNWKERAEAAEAALAGAKADADRYRWLLPHLFAGSSRTPPIETHHAFIDNPKCHHLEGKALEAAIDAAMASEHERSG